MLRSRAAAVLLPLVRRRAVVSKRDFKLAKLGVEVGSFLRQQDCLLTGNAVSKEPGRQITDANLLMAGGDDEPLNEIFKLAHIARPGVFLEDRERIVGEILAGTPLATQCTSRKYSQSREMSPLRSRNGGRSTGIT